MPTVPTKCYFSLLLLMKFRAFVAGLVRKLILLFQGTHGDRAPDTFQRMKSIQKSVDARWPEQDWKRIMIFRPSTGRIFALQIRLNLCLLLSDWEHIKPRTAVAGKPRWPWRLSWWKQQKTTGANSGDLNYWQMLSKAWNSMMASATTRQISRIQSKWLYTRFDYISFTKLMHPYEFMDILNVLNASHIRLLSISFCGW